MVGTFGEELKKILSELKVTEGELAAALGKSQKTVSRYICGETDPKDEIKEKIIGILVEMAAEENELMKTKLERSYRKLLLGVSVPTDMNMEKDRKKYPDWYQNFSLKVMNMLKVDLNKRFSEHKEQQKKILEHLELFRKIEPYEMDILRAIKIIKKQKNQQKK